MRSKRAPLRSGLGHFHHDHHLFGRVTLLQFLRDVLRDFHCLFLSRDRNLDGLFGGALKKALFRQELPSRMHQPSRCAPSFVDLFCFGVCRVMLRGRYTPNEHRCSAARAAQHHICRKTRPHTRTSSTAGAICSCLAFRLFVFMVSTVGKSTSVRSQYHKTYWTSACA